MIAAGTALALTPTASPVRDAAYQASIAITRALSSTLRGIANASAPKSAAASARSASEKLDAITPVRCDVAKSTTGMAQAKGRQPRRRQFCSTADHDAGIHGSGETDPRERLAARRRERHHEPGRDDAGRHRIPRRIVNACVGARRRSRAPAATARGTPCGTCSRPDPQPRCVRRCGDLRAPRDRGGTGAKRIAGEDVDRRTLELFDSDACQPPAPATAAAATAAWPRIVGPRGARRRRQRSGSLPTLPDNGDRKADAPDAVAGGERGGRGGRGRAPRRR